MVLSTHSRKPFSRAKGTSSHERGAKGSRKGSVSTHHQLLLLHKGIKKAKQFELRKLIRRLKAAAAASTAGSESTAIKFAAVTSERLQAKYDTTKSLNTEVVLQQAASCCGLPQDAAACGQPSNMLGKELPEASAQLIQLACSRLLSATCVKQQIQAIKYQQQEQSATVAEAQPTPSEVSRAAQQGPPSLEESGADETRTSPLSVLHEHYSRVNAMGDNDAAQDAEEDCQIADAAMARLFHKRANAAEQSSNSDNSAADLSQQSDASHGISCSEADSAELDMAQSQQPDIFSEAGQKALQQNKRKRITHRNVDCPASKKQKKENPVKAGQKPKEMPKKKKNRLGQRARQQLGRAKQSQQMLHGPYPTPPLLKPHAGQAAPGMKSTQVRGPAVNSVESKPPAAGPVHPSWLAIKKQKQKQALLTAAPQGSRTVFSDDGQIMASSPAHSPAAILPKSASKAPAAALKPAAARLTAAEAKDMHPSWIAKRVAIAKQAELANGKKASKIVFDD